MVGWIVCLGTERSVVDRRVAGPASPSPGLLRDVPLADCLACRRLMAAFIDRFPTSMCSAGRAGPTTATLGGHLAL